MRHVFQFANTTSKTSSKQPTFSFTNPVPNVEWILCHVFNPRGRHEGVVLGHNGAKEIHLGILSCGEDDVVAVCGQIRHSVSDTGGDVIPLAELLHQYNVRLIGQCG